MKELIILAALILLGGYLYLKRTPGKTAIDAVIADIMTADPNIDIEHATAIAAADVASNAANAAAQAEKDAQVQAAADAVTQAEREAAAAQAAAILAAEEEATVAAAIAAEEAAKKARAELEARWREALKKAEAELTKAKDAATIALNSYDKQLAILKTPNPVICYYHINYGGRYSVFNTKETAESRDLRNAPGLEVVNIGGRPGSGVGNDDMSSVNVKKGFIARLYGHINYGGSYIDLYENTPTMPAGWNDTVSSVRVLDTPARTILSNVRIEALAATTAARLTTERVLTIAADVRLLGILLAEADRLDSIAEAARNKIATIEARLK